MDWAAAEDLALASVLEDGVSIRLTGEDVERGTFSHRHAVLHDAETGRRHVPLQALPQARAAFEIHNSPLTESATVGFEFGYNVQEPARLVIWEAQYGDFINGAQVIIDEFITSGRAKWGLTPSLVLLLPHGYEGQGPDHSSARARALPRSGGRHQPARRQLHDGRAVLPSAAAAGGAARRPIRCRSSCSRRRACCAIRWSRRGRSIWPKAAGSRSSIDTERQAQAGDVRRLLLCSGKVYVDLVSSELRATTPEIADLPRRAAVSVRLERPRSRLSAASRRSRKSSGCRKSRRTWARGRSSVRCSKTPSTDGGRCATWAAREAPARPKARWAWHTMNQKTLVTEAFQPAPATRQTSMVLSKQM